MSEPRWLSPGLILAIHEAQLREHGGPSGIRDTGALESALSRARNRWLYESADWPDLASAYAFGLARNHAFVDGNKRTALIAMITFLGLNKIQFTATEQEAVVMIRDLAAGEIVEPELALWTAGNMRHV